MLYLTILHMHWIEDTTLCYMLAHWNEILNWMCQLILYPRFTRKLNCIPILDKSNTWNDFITLNPLLYYWIAFSKQQIRIYMKWKYSPRGVFEINQIVLSRDVSQVSTLFPNPKCPNLQVGIKEYKKVIDPTCRL